MQGRKVEAWGPPKSSTLEKWSLPSPVSLLWSSTGTRLLVDVFRLDGHGEDWSFLRWAFLCWDGWHCRCVVDSRSAILNLLWAVTSFLDAQILMTLTMRDLSRCYVNLSMTYFWIKFWRARKALPKDYDTCKLSKSLVVKVPVTSHGVWTNRLKSQLCE